MNISREELHHLARLCRLSFGKDEEKDISGDISRIIAFVDELKEADISESSGTEPLPPAATPLVDDLPRTGLNHNEALSPAPESVGDFFRFPQTIFRAD